MPKRYLLILGAFFVSVLMYVDRVCISAAKTDIASDLNFTDKQMGWVMAAFSLGYAFFQVPSGKLADRYGARIVLTGVCLAWSVLTALTGVVRGFYLMFGLRFLFGAGEAGGYPTLTRAFTSWLPMNERGITNSISFSGGRLGAAIAYPGVVALITYLEAWQKTFFVFGFVGIGFAILWYMLFRDTPEEHPAVSPQERDLIVAGRIPPQRTDRSGQAIAPESVTFRQMLGSGNLRRLMFQYVAQNFTFFFTMTWFFPYMSERFALSNQQTAWYAAAPLLCGVLGNGLAGYSVDRLYSAGNWQASRRLPAAIGFSLAAVGMVACTNMPSPLTAVAAMCLAIFGCDMVLSPSWSTCMDIGGKSAGAVSGSMNMVGNLGGFGASLAFPYLYGWTQMHEPFFYLAAVLNVISIYLWFQIRPEVSIQEEREARDE